MNRLLTDMGVTLSYDCYGSGPPLVLVHGAFSDHDTNWEFIRPKIEAHFTVYAVARRGRGQTDATTGHSVIDEAADVESLLRAIDEPAFLLGHSYGAHVALVAAHDQQPLIRKLVLYEPARSSLLGARSLAMLETLARRRDWDGLAYRFFGEVLSVPAAELDAVRASELWAPILSDAEATMHDFRALARYDFRAERFRNLCVPVLLQIGSESPRDLYVTDALAGVLPDAAIGVLSGQAHEGMTTAPDQYADAVIEACLALPPRKGAALPMMNASG